MPMAKAFTPGIPESRETPPSGKLFSLARGQRVAGGGAWLERWRSAGIMVRNTLHQAAPGTYYGQWLGTILRNAHRGEAGQCP
jgi:hypothetical protein